MNGRFRVFPPWRSRAGYPAGSRWRSQLLPTRVRGPLVVVGVLAVLVLLWRLDPAAPGPFPRCPLLWLTDLQCAGCGVLRATHALLHGEFAKAWALNPLFVLAVPLGLVAALASALGCARPGAHPRVVFVVMVVLVSFTVLRNI